MPVLEYTEGGEEGEAVAPPRTQPRNRGGGGGRKRGGSGGGAARAAAAAVAAAAAAAAVLAAGGGTEDGEAAAAAQRVALLGVTDPRLLSSEDKRLRRMERKAESARVARRRNKEAAETLERELAALRAGTAGAEEPALLLTDAAYTVPAYRSEVPSPPPAAAVAEVYAPEGVSEDEAEAEAIAEAGASPPSHMAVWQPIAAAAASAEPHPSPSPSPSAGAASGKIAQPRAARVPPRVAARAAAALGGNGLSPHKWPPW